jgi:glycosyltransferase involved in cell wall biosynthesis
LRIGIFATGGFPPFNIGGVSIITYELVRSLSELGHELIVLIPHNSSCSKLQMPSPMDGVSFRFINTGLPSFFWRGTGEEIAALRNLQSQCDVVHYQAPPVTFDVFSPSVLRLFRKKQTYWYTGDVHNYPLNYSLFKFNQNFFDRIIYSDNYIYSLSKRRGISEEKFVYIPEPVKISMFDQAQPLALEGSPSVLYVGRLHPDKDLMTLLKSISRVKVELPNVRLHIVGSGKDTEKIRSLIETLGLTDFVVLHGSKPYFDLPAFYKGADMVAYPIGQYFTNGPGLVTLETLASKTPLITSVHAGSQHLLKDGENALLSPIADDKLLSENILRIHSDKALAEKISQNGYNLVRKFDWNEIVLEFVETWRMLLE